MNLNEYKNAMSEIKVNTEEVEASIHRKMNHGVKERVKRLVPAFAAIMVMVIIFAFWYEIPSNSPAISMTVYAAEQEVPLTKEFVMISANANPFFGSSSIDENGNYYDSKMNYNINFKCEGEDIETITYICSDQEITRGNMSVAAYYVENITMPLEEYKKYREFEDEQFLCGFYGEGEANANITKLIGSSYTVNYEEQRNIQYGLVVVASVDGEGDYIMEDLTLRVEIQLKDGSVVEKKILLDFGETGFSEIGIRIL